MLPSLLLEISTASSSARIKTLAATATLIVTSVGSSTSAPLA
jgi:hypothetical protein